MISLNKYILVDNKNYIYFTCGNFQIMTDRDTTGICAVSLPDLSNPPHTRLSFYRDRLPPDFFFTLSSVTPLSVYNVCNLYLECHLRKPLSRHSHAQAVCKDISSACHPAHLLILLWVCAERCCFDRQHTHETKRWMHECKHMEEGKHGQ